MTSGSGAAPVKSGEQSEKAGGIVSTRHGIVVLDFGGQYTQLIARRIREQQVFSAILPCTARIEEIRALEPAGIVLSGGPSSVYDATAPVCDPKVLQLDIPVLGICYGMQWLAHTLGGKVELAERREYGRAELAVEKSSKLFGDCPDRFTIWNSHGDHVVGLPEGFTVTGRTDNAIGAAENVTKKLYGVEFHPEVNHTEHGTEILSNFVFQICGAKRNWDRAGFITSMVDSIRKQAEGSRAICALSGGVDSAVAAALVHRAIGDRLTNVFVDNGLLRRNEFHDTLELLRARLGLNVIGVDASDRFLGRLKGITDPEEKRKRIGGEFINVFVEEARKLTAASQGPPVKFLVQGTLYPDVIESVSVKGPSAVIKTHHNVGGLPADMPFKLIEPLRDFIQGRGATDRARVGFAGRNFDQASVSRAGISGEAPRRSLARKTGDLAGGGCRSGGGDPARRVVPKSLAGFCGSFAGTERGRDGGRADVRVYDRGACCEFAGCDDGRLVPAAA
jgi:GMP synthase (glutamine-hydrolysing)